MKTPLLNNSKRVGDDPSLPLKYFDYILYTALKLSFGREFRIVLTPIIRFLDIMI